MVLPVELLLAFTLVAAVCEQCGAAAEDGEPICRECRAALDEPGLAEVAEGDDES